MPAQPYAMYCSQPGHPAYHGVPGQPHQAGFPPQQPYSHPHMTYYQPLPAPPPQQPPLPKTQQPPPPQRSQHRWIAQQPGPRWKFRDRENLRLRISMLDSSYLNQVRCPLTISLPHGCPSGLPLHDSAPQVLSIVYPDKHIRGGEEYTVDLARVADDKCDQLDELLSHVLTTRMAGGASHAPSCAPKEPKVESRVSPVPHADGFELLPNDSFLPPGSPFFERSPGEHFQGGSGSETRKRKPGRCPRGSPGSSSLKRPTLPDKRGSNGKAGIETAATNLDSGADLNAWAEGFGETDGLADMGGNIDGSIGVSAGVGDSSKQTSMEVPTKKHARIEVSRTGKNSEWEMASIIQVTARKQLVFYDVDNSFEWLDFKAEVRVVKGEYLCTPSPPLHRCHPLSISGLSR